MSQYNNNVVIIVQTMLELMASVCPPVPLQGAPHPALYPGSVMRQSNSNTSNHKPLPL